MNKRTASVFGFITLSAATSWLGFPHQWVQAQATAVATGMPQAERPSHQRLTPDELFDQQQRQQELLQDQWQRQQNQWQRQQDQWQQQFNQQQLQQLLIQQQQQRQQQQLNQPRS